MIFFKLNYHFKSLLQMIFIKQKYHDLMYWGKYHKDNYKW